MLISEKYKQPPQLKQSDTRDTVSWALGTSVAVVSGAQTLLNFLAQASSAIGGSDQKLSSLKANKGETS